MFKKKKNNSLLHRNNMLFRLSIAVFITLLSSILFVFYSLLHQNKMEKEYSSLIQNINQMAIEIQQSPDSVSEELQLTYKKMVLQTQNLDRHLLPERMLSAPLYEDKMGSDRYRGLLRNFIAKIRENYSNFEERIQFINILLLVLSLITISFHLLLIHKNTRDQKRLVKNINRGLNSVREMLLYDDVDLRIQETEYIEELSQFYYDIEQIYRSIQFTRNLQNIDIHGDLNKLLQQLYQVFSGFLECDRVALAFITGNGLVTAETAFCTYPIQRLEPGFSEPIDNTSLHKLQDSQGPRIINDLEEFSKGRKISDSTALLLLEGVHSSITLPLFFKDKCVGFLFLSSRKKVEYTQQQADEANRTVNIMKQKLYIEFLLERTISETSRAFVSLMSEKDNETSDHIMRMSNYSFIIARKYNSTVASLSPRFLREMLWYAPLHDIGKIGTPDAILHKEGKLNDQEWAVMRNHVSVGERIIRAMNKQFDDLFSNAMMQTAVDIIQGHHEKFDGSGYPRGLSGKDIPLAGRIVAVADVFDALTSKRPYKEAYSIEKSLFIMQNEMQGHFDIEIFNCLQEAMPEIQKIYEEFKEI